MRAILLLTLFLGSGALAGDYRVLTGHGGPVMDVAVSPDATRALTASFDNSVGVWDLGSDQVTFLDGHEAAVKTVIFTGAGQAASGGDDYAIQVWDLTTATPLYRMKGHKGPIQGLAVSPDGTQLASASWDGSIGLWDLATGTMTAQMTGHEARVNDVAYANDGRTLISASADGTIRTWDPETAQQTRIMLRHGFGVTCLLVNDAAGWMVYGATDGGTRVIDLKTDAVLADLTLDRRPILALAADPDFSQFSVGDGEGHIMVVDTTGWNIRHDFRAAQRGPIWALAYVRDALIAGGIDDAAVVWPIGAKAQGPIMATITRDFLRAPETMGNGERQFARKCSICHSLSDDDVRRAGPNLHDLFGRRAGSLPGYIYSDTVANSDIIWSETTIDALFDEGPDHYIPGTKMPMQRITSPDDRADLIAFLRDNTKG